MFLACRNEEAVPGFAPARGQNQHEAAVEVAALAAEHRLLDVGGLFCQRLNYPL